MENFLLANEQLLTSTPNNVVVLTTHRLRYDSLQSGRPQLVSMMLEKVSACEVSYHSHPILLILGLVALIGALVATGQAGLPAGGILAFCGIVLFIVFLVTRRHVVNITADSGTRLTFETKGLKTEMVVNFINSLERAKHQRMMELA